MPSTRLPESPDRHSLPGVTTSRLPDLLLLAVIGCVLFAIRLTGAPNLLDNEFRLGACVLDALQHGNWLCPHDVLGNTDKPPLLTWLSALASWPGGRVTRFTLYLPTAVATVAIAWLVAIAAGRTSDAAPGSSAGSPISSPTSVRGRSRLPGGTDCSR